MLVVISLLLYNVIQMVIQSGQGKAKLRSKSTMPVAGVLNQIILKDQAMRF